MEPSERWQPIAPATDEPGQQRAAPDSKKRRQAIAVACVQCRSSKVKCDGARPQCTRCHELDLPCRFDVAEGVSRAERMKLLKNQNMSHRAEEMERVIQALRTGSDEQASSILARLRIGDRLDEILQGLPPLSSPGMSRPPSLLAQDSTSTSASRVITDPTPAVSDSRGSLYTLDTSAPYSPNMGPSSRPGSDPTLPPSQTTSAKGKQPAAAIEAPASPFLVILFDREDYLGALSESEDENDQGHGGEPTSFIDPRLLFQSSVFDAAGASMVTPVESTRSRRYSPRKDSFTRHRGLTHLSNRQPMANTIHVHPNFNLRNLFGNLPFSSSIRANNYPLDIQDVQVDNFFLPIWAMMTISTRPDPGSVKEAFYSLYRDTTAVLNNGTLVESVIEIHPNIGALFDEDEYNRSGVLSKWSAAMVHSAQLRGNDFTAYASMYLNWYLARWMVSPSPETYEAMPEWLRPTPNQLFMPHINTLDYVIWPAFREFAVQIPEMQEHMEYMVDMSTNIRCDWYFAREEALYRHEDTGMLDMCDLAKTSLRDLTGWSLGPSFGQYIMNADTYVRIRPEDT